MESAVSSEVAPASSDDAGVTGAPKGPTRKQESASTLAVALRLERDAPELIREPVTDDDLVDVCSEAWLEGVLRRGKPSVAMDDMATRVIPIPSKDGRVCTGYTIETVDHDGHTARRDFSIRSLEDVAVRAAQRLISRGILAAEDTYYFELLAQPRPAKAAQARTQRRTADNVSRRRKGSEADDGVDAGANRAQPFKGERRILPLTVLTVPVEPLLRRAEVIGPADEETWKVFYTERALVKAECFARKGASSHPPVETGGVLIGALCACPETGDFFVVVVDVLEVTDAEHEKFSLSYSGKTWKRIQTVLRARQSRRSTRAHRIVGQCHGHNFVPLDGAPPCELCPQMEVCGRSSVFVSRDDVVWSRAVFRHQPWNLSHIFGLNAREEQVQGLFAQRDGRFQERGFRVIVDVDVEGL